MFKYTMLYIIMWAQVAQQIKNIENRLEGTKKRVNCHGNRILLELREWCL